MPVVHFRPQLRRFTETAEVHTDARSLRAALEAGFAVNPRLRGYVLDDPSHLRANVVVFVDGWQLRAKGMRAADMPPERAEDANVQDPHRVVRRPAQPEVLWCQHHNGIWRSTDDALSWVEVTTAPVSNFGFAVAVHPRDPDTAWFVPAEADQRRVPIGAALVVNRSTDGGRSFSSLRQGLPQQDCYDLVYRHGLAVADDGRSLLMGSTTGGLWASLDGGDSWQTASLNLPPIAAVRFG